MSELRIKTREELHQHLLALRPDQFGLNHPSCLIGQACLAVYGRVSRSFAESGYPIDIARVVAAWNDRAPRDDRQQLVPVLPHPTEVAELSPRRLVALTVWVIKQALPVGDVTTGSAAVMVAEQWLAGDPVTAAQIARISDPEWRPLNLLRNMIVAVETGVPDIMSEGTFDALSVSAGIAMAEAISDIAARSEPKEIVADGKSWLTEFFAARSAIIAQYPEEAEHVDHGG